MAAGSDVIFTDDVSLQVFFEHLQRLAVQSWGQMIVESDTVLWVLDLKWFGKFTNDVCCPALCCCIQLFSFLSFVLKQREKIGGLRELKLKNKGKQDLKHDSLGFWSNFV